MVNSQFNGGLNNGLNGEFQGGLNEGLNNDVNDGLNDGLNGGLNSGLNSGLNRGLNRGLHSDAGLCHSVTNSGDMTKQRAPADSVYQIGLYIPWKGRTDCSWRCLVSGYKKGRKKRENRSRFGP